MDVKFNILLYVTSTKTTYSLKTCCHKLHDFQDPFCYDTNAALHI
jgi:hypothetical protein